MRGLSDRFAGSVVVVGVSVDYVLVLTLVFCLLIKAPMQHKKR